jgi:hypothetical protein
MTRRFMPDFTYADLIYLIPKIRYATKAFFDSSMDSINCENKTSRVG